MNSLRQRLRRVAPGGRGALGGTPPLAAWLAGGCLLGLVWLPGDEGGGALKTSRAECAGRELGVLRCAPAPQRRRHAEQGVQGTRLVVALPAPHTPTGTTGGGGDTTSLDTTSLGRGALATKAAGRAGGAPGGRAARRRQNAPVGTHAGQPSSLSCTLSTSVHSPDTQVHAAKRPRCVGRSARAARLRRVPDAYRQGSLPHPGKPTAPSEPPSLSHHPGGSPSQAPGLIQTIASAFWPVVYAHCWAASPRPPQLSPAPRHLLISHGCPARRLAGGAAARGGGHWPRDAQGGAERGGGRPSRQARRLPG